MDGVEIMGQASRYLGETAELVWRKDCVGCARTDVTPVAVGSAVCRDCAALLRRPPDQVAGSRRPPVAAAGPYGGVHRAVVLAAKDHHRSDAVQVLGEIIAGVLRHLVCIGALPDPRLAPLILLPAPTRRSAARARGGCVVSRATGIAAAQLAGSVRCVDVAYLAEGTPDSVGLSRWQRGENFSRGLVLDAAAIRRVRRLLRTPGAVTCVVDDVSTTGATLAGFSLALAAHGIIPCMGVVAAKA